MSKKITLALAILLLGLLLGAGGPGGAGPGPSALSGEPVTWYERGRQKQAFLALDEIALFPGRGVGGAAEVLRGERDYPGAAVLRQNGYALLLRLPAPLDAARLRERSAARSLAEPGETGLVFYADHQRGPGGRMVLRNEIVVRFPDGLDEAGRLELERSHGLTLVRELTAAPNTFLYRAADPLTALETANRLQASDRVAYASPNWLHSRFKRAIPNDPLFPNQWHLLNTGQGGGTPGQDIHVTPVWDTWRGSHEEVIAIVDTGIEKNHEDLKANTLTDLGWDWVDNDDDPEWVDDDHGVHVAGTAAGRGFNAIGISGVAPWAALVGHRLLGAETDVNESEALTRNKNVVDIYNNSWGPADDGLHLRGPGPVTEDALESGARTGRGGLGCIYVWAGGNGYDFDNSNYDGYANSRYTIAVASSTNFGVRANYSEKGANLVVNAPSSGGTLAITTTAGHNSYTSSYGGTSASAPQVSGVVALMLEANPNLTWRDVQAILAETATKNNPGDADWTMNGAGYHVNHKYGFGRVDAQAAVSRAATWVSLAEEVQAAKSSCAGLPILDNDLTGVTDTITLASDLTVEFVTVIFNAPTHLRWGDLEIVLVSPAGTESILAETHESAVTGSQAGEYNGWRFGTVRCFGELSRGPWTLRVRDRMTGYTGRGGGGGGMFHQGPLVNSGRMAASRWPCSKRLASEPGEC
jgi:kexin